jgi:glycosyltransferase involved in cell wall biosynthesis
MKNPNPLKVSVIVPAYNYGCFLAECIESAINQTMPPDEIIIVDDGSTDSTPEVVQPYLVDRSVKYIRIDNSGVSAARNKGIIASTGGIIGLLDADDIWRSDKLELQVPLFENPRVGVVYSLFQPFNENGPITNYRRTSLQRGHILAELTCNNFIPTSSALVRRSCFDEFGAFNERVDICEDLELWIRMAADGVEFDFVNQPLTMYRVHSGSLISDVSRKYRQHYSILRELFDGVGKEMCTKETQANAWANLFAERAYDHLERSNRRNALIDAMRSIYHRPFGVLDSMAWRILAKSMMPQILVNLLRESVKGIDASKSNAG